MALLWFEGKYAETGLAFSAELCAWHFSRLPSVSASKYDVHMSSAEAALHYILPSLWDGKAILKTSTFWFVIRTRPHTLLLLSGLRLTALQLLFISWIVPCIKGNSRDKLLFIYWYLVAFFVLFCLGFFLVSLFFLNVYLSAFVLFLDFLFFSPRLTKKEGRKSAGETEVKEIHQPRIC